MPKSKPFHPAADERLEDELVLAIHRIDDQNARGRGQPSTEGEEDEAGEATARKDAGGIETSRGSDRVGETISLCGRGRPDDHARSAPTAAITLGDGGNQASRMSAVTTLTPTLERTQALPEG